MIERQPVEDRRNIGEFPYRRGETPIFNFDDGDEAFVQVYTCCVFLPAFGCCAHLKAGQNNFLGFFQPFLFIVTFFSDFVSELKKKCGN